MLVAVYAARGLGGGARGAYARAAFVGAVVSWSVPFVLSPHRILEGPHPPDVYWLLYGYWGMIAGLCFALSGGLLMVVSRDAIGTELLEGSPPAAVFIASILGAAVFAVGSVLGSGPGRASALERSTANLHWGSPIGVVLGFFFGTLMIVGLGGAALLFRRLPWITPMLVAAVGVTGLTTLGLQIRSWPPSGAGDRLMLIGAAIMFVTWLVTGAWRSTSMRGSRGRRLVASSS